MKKNILNIEKNLTIGRKIQSIFINFKQKILWPQQCNTINLLGVYSRITEKIKNPDTYKKGTTVISSQIDRKITKRYRGIMKTLKVGMLQEIQNWGLINSNSKQFTSTCGALDLLRKGLWVSQAKETLIDKQTKEIPLSL